MDFSEYIEVLAPNDIRIRGTRVGIETVLQEYLNNKPAEEIARSHPSLSLAEIYATMAYYFENRDAMDDYLSNWRRENQLAREEQERHPSPAVARLRSIKHRGTNGAVGHE